MPVARPPGIALARRWARVGKRILAYEPQTYAKALASFERYVDWHEREHAQQAESLATAITPEDARADAAVDAAVVMPDLSPPDVDTKAN